MSAQPSLLNARGILFSADNVFVLEREKENAPWFFIGEEANIEPNGGD